MKKKKTIIILLFLLMVGIVGLTIAYFSNSGTIQNVFKTKDYKVRLREKFVSPDNWLPCDTTEKKVYVVNTGDTDEAVRISYTEKWVAEDGTILSGLIDMNGNLTNEEEYSEHAAIINFANDCNWQEYNGYYYFKHILKPGESTNTLIDSVTFNCNTNASQNCTKSQDGKSIVCTSNGNGYDNATYTLTFKIDTIQYDAYEEEWTDDVYISDISYDPSIDNCSSGGYTNPSMICSNESDEPITYNGEQYYVIDSTNEEYITLLKKDVLTASEVNAISTEFVSEDGEYPYGRNDGCDGSEIGMCYLYIHYDDSNIKTIIDEWSNQFGNDLVEVDGYKARLLNEDELRDRLGYEYHFVITGSKYEKSECSPNWVNVNDKFYWTDVTYQITKKGVVNDEFLFQYIYDNAYIRPVINVKKCVINGTC